MFAPAAWTPTLAHPWLPGSVQSRRDPDNVRRHGAHHPPSSLGIRMGLRIHDSLPAVGCTSANPEIVSCYVDGLSLTLLSL